MRYLFITEAKDTSLGQIERGLALLGFRVVSSEVEGTLAGDMVEYAITFEPGKIGPTGKLRYTESRIRVLTEEEA